MTRFINAVLISVFAFFVFVAVFWQFTGDDGEARTPGGAARVTAVDATWQPAGQQEILLEMQVSNPSSLESRVTAVSYQAQSAGQVLDSAVSRPLAPAVAVAGKSEAPVGIAVDLPSGFALAWWSDYMESGESGDLVIQGTLSVRRDDGTRDVPFEWRSAWSGGLADALTKAASNCGAGGTDVCLSGGAFRWQDGALRADLVLANPAAESVAVRNTTVTLLFGDRAVVAGSVDLAETLAAGDEANVSLALPFAPEAIEQWWPEHVGRCERTPVTLRMQLQVQPLGEDAEEAGLSALQWVFPSSSFQTRFLCDS